jgi:hypothetical protein
VPKSSREVSLRCPVSMIVPCPACAYSMGPMVARRSGEVPCALTAVAAAASLFLRSQTLPALWLLLFAWSSSSSSDQEAALIWPAEQRPPRHRGEWKADKQSVLVIRPVSRVGVAWRLWDPTSHPWTATAAVRWWWWWCTDRTAVVVVGRPGSSAISCMPAQGDDGDVIAIKSSTLQTRRASARWLGGRRHGPIAPLSRCSKLGSGGGGLRVVRACGIPSSSFASSRRRVVVVVVVFLSVAQSI